LPRNIGSQASESIMQDMWESGCCCDDCGSTSLMRAPVGHIWPRPRARFHARRSGRMQCVAKAADYAPREAL